MEIKINFKTKSELYPKFGNSNLDGNISIRRDLPKCVQNFLIEHETYHVNDKEIIVWKRELNANIAGFKKHPLGAILCILMSLQPYRIYYMIKYYKENKTTKDLR